jgi:hypothetical protein
MVARAPLISSMGALAASAASDIGLSIITRHCERSEAIHLLLERKNGLLRRFAPRNDGPACV